MSTRHNMKTFAAYCIIWFLGRFHIKAESNFTKAVVLARFNEQVGWVSRIPLDVQVFIYQSSDPQQLNYVPNVHGETLKYLKYIVDEYDHLSTHTVFLHAHEHSYHNLLCSESCTLIPNCPIRASAVDIIKAYDWKGNFSMLPGANMLNLCRKSRRFDAVNYVRQAFGIQHVIRPCVRYTISNAQFGVSKSVLQKYPREKYLEVYRSLLHGRLPGTEIPAGCEIGRCLGLAFEFSWSDIFALRDKPPSHEHCLIRPCIRRWGNRGCT
mmetsp:Transcript_22907/g.38317  ORF Transcript_22907/g.38317 Transcript_22907/m.38317 type:complete len:267 (-) Transcript_22907:1475-2275(-)